MISFPSWSSLVPLSFALVVAECLQETIDRQMNKLVENTKYLLPCYFTEITPLKNLKNLIENLPLEIDIFSNY